MVHIETLARDGLLLYARRSFSSLSVRNYRLYFTGQAISLSGNWIQAVAQTWLVLQLTHSGTQLGVIAGLQFLPILLFGAFGGVIADRFDKRHILYVTQTLAMILAFIPAVLVGLDIVQLWMIYALAFGLGLVQMIDSPARQSFVVEMVGTDKLTNAVSLNSVEVNLARAIGPLIGAGLIATVGLKWCFLINGLTFIAVLICLSRMDSSSLFIQPHTTRIKGQLGEGLRYIWHTPILRNVLIMMAIIGALSYEFQVVIPVFATKTFHGNASSYAAMMGAIGAGSLLGGLITAGRGNQSPKRLVSAALAFGVSMLLAASAPTHFAALLLLGLVGFSSISFNALTNSTLQLNSAPLMRGRVMAIWGVAFLGSTPIGGPVIGWICEHGSPRTGLIIGGVAAIIASMFGVLALYHHNRRALVADILRPVEERISL